MGQHGAQIGAQVRHVWAQMCQLGSQIGQLEAYFDQIGAQMSQPDPFQPHDTLSTNLGPFWPIGYPS